MTKTKPISLSRKIGDDALEAKTGKPWKQWIALLDKAKAHQMPHKQIAEYLYHKFGLPGWWCQMIAAGYEQAKGLRVKHQNPTGFEISISKTMSIDASAAFDLWHNSRSRKRIVEQQVELRIATAPKSLRFDWIDGTIFEVRINAKGEKKCQTVIQHFKLKNAGSAEKMKRFWAERLKNMGERVVV